MLIIQYFLFSPFSARDLFPSSSIVNPCSDILFNRELSAGNQGVKITEEPNFWDHYKMTRQ